MWVCQNSGRAKKESEMDLEIDSSDNCSSYEERDTTGSGLSASTANMEEKKKENKAENGNQMLIFSITLFFFPLFFF